MSDQSTPAHLASIGRVIVPVSDQERAIDFYCGVLGLEKRADVPMGGPENYRWVEVAPSGETTGVAIVPPGPNGRAPGGETGICFEAADIEALHSYLREQGVDVDEEIMRMGDPVPPMFWLRDPDGNSLMVAENPAGGGDASPS
jgi:catechol 2,3-dioxygenase-like lactoylglutathione lyase family enzyme